ncbi:MAG: penicillin acylase family protein [Hyphomicrobiales bacterium]|nr:penicillin acylase family protein [Hyphomicrobiales bacterium]
MRLLIALAVLGAFAGAYLFWRAMPAYSGREKLPGLSAEARVWRDAYGVPHIFAASMDDAMRTLGYLHASERLFQMEVLRRAGQGRTAELIGADGIPIDKVTRTLGFYREAEMSFAALSPWAQRRLQAYADGVNAFLTSHEDALPPEFLILGDRPEPWRPADSLVWGKLFSFQNSHNYTLEVLRARLREKLGPEKVSWFFPGAPPGSPVTTMPALNVKHAAAESVKAQIEAMTGVGHGSSNEWVVAGSRTTTGKPILANDPHLGLAAPIIWYLARIVTPEGWVKGATIPGAPIVALGQSQSIAWGFTNADTDVEDLFIETVDPSNPSRYMAPDGAKPFETREETIHVKDGADVKLTIRATRHGPILSDVSEDVGAIAAPGKVVALAFSGLGDHDTTAEAMMRLNAARNWNDFLDALRLYQTPTQNIVYADIAGDIGFFSPGLVPLRKSGDGLAPADGASGAFDWIGVVPFDELPQLHNPEAGFVFNANNANVPADRQPTFGQDWEEDFRARRIQEFMGAIDKHSLDTAAAMQADRVSLDAKELQPFIAMIAPSDERARQAQAMLLSWNAVMDKERPEPLVYAAFLRSLNRILIEEKTGVGMDADKGPFAATTLVSLMREHASWCDSEGSPDPDCKKTLGRAFDEGLALLVKRDGADMSRWRWGAEHVSVLRHQVFGHVPLIDRASDLSVSSSGGFYTLDRGGGFETPADLPFARTHGPGFRGVYDLAEPEKSRFMIATGESGHIFSRHYRDLTRLWNDVRSITLTGSEDDLKKAGAAELILTP